MNMNSSQNGSFVPPYTRKYTQHLARLQQTRASIDSKVSSDPIERRSYGRKFSTPSADHSRSHYSDRTFGAPRPLSAGRGVFNPTREDRPRSQSASRGRSLSQNRNNRSLSRSRSRSLSANSTAQQPISRALGVAHALIAEKRQQEQLEQLQSSYLNRLSQSSLQPSLQHTQTKQWIPAKIVTRAAAPPPSLSSVISQKAWRRAPWPAFVPRELKAQVNHQMSPKFTPSSPISYSEDVGQPPEKEWRQVELPRLSSRHIALTTRFIRPKPLHTDPHLQAPSYGVLVLPRHELSAVELIKFVERQFNLPGQVTDIALAIRRQYSNDRLFLGCLSLDTHRLPDPLVLQGGEGDCEAVVYLGGTGYDPKGLSPFATEEDEDYYDFDTNLTTAYSNNNNSNNAFVNSNSNFNNSNSNQREGQSSVTGGGGLFLSSMAKDTAAFAAFSAASRRHPAERQASRRQLRQQQQHHASPSLHSNNHSRPMIDSKEKVRQEHHSLLHRFSEPLDRSFALPQSELEQQQQSAEDQLLQDEEHEQQLFEMSKQLNSRTNSPPPLPATLSTISARRGLTVSDLRLTNNTTAAETSVSNNRGELSPRPPLFHHEDNIAFRDHHSHHHHHQQGLESVRTSVTAGAGGNKVTAASVAAELKRLEILYDRIQRRARGKVEDPPQPVIKRPVVEVSLHSRGAVAVEKHLQRMGTMTGHSPRRQQPEEVEKVVEEEPVTISEPQPVAGVANESDGVEEEEEEKEEKEEKEAIIEQPRKVHEIFFDLRDLMVDATGTATAGSSTNITGGDRSKHRR